MTDPEPVDPYPWLPLDVVANHLGVKAESPNLVGVERARQASADYCQDNRRDLFAWALDEDGLPLVPPVRVFLATPRIVEAALLCCARLDGRKGSPAGLASYGEFATAVLRSDPDVERMLGVGRYAKPAVR